MILEYMVAQFPAQLVSVKIVQFRESFLNSHVFQVVPELVILFYVLSGITDTRVTVNFTVSCSCE